jgi:uncharacterized coiled-coil DUF342 family protein
MSQLITFEGSTHVVMAPEELEELEAKLARLVDECDVYRQECDRYRQERDHYHQALQDIEDCSWKVRQIACDALKWEARL